ncbi:MAG: hypothetical protein M0Z56_02265 [Desulfobacteraceae bacterium]|nr:hypothetical protein [Desulfobacteraceae bacterium]
MKKNVVLAMTICFTLAAINGYGAALPSSPRFDASTFFPLTSGKRYVYKETTPEGSGMIRLQFGNPKKVKGISILVTPVAEITAKGGTGEIAYYSIDKVKGLINHGEDDIEAGCVERLNPGLLIPNGLAPGKTVKQSVNVKLTGTGCPKASRCRYTITYENNETVTVPMGTYKECAKIRITEQWMNAADDIVSKGDKLIYLSPGIGLVKEIEFVSGGKETSELTAVEADTSPAD